MCSCHKRTLGELLSNWIFRDNIWNGHFKFVSFSWIGSISIYFIISNIGNICLQRRFVTLNGIYKIVNAIVFIWKLLLYIPWARYNLDIIVAMILEKTLKGIIALTSPFSIVENGHSSSHFLTPENFFSRERKTFQSFQVVWKGLIVAVYFVPWVASSSLNYTV